MDKNRIKNQAFRTALDILDDNSIWEFYDKNIMEMIESHGSVETDALVDYFSLEENKQKKIAYKLRKNPYIINFILKIVIENNVSLVCRNGAVRKRNQLV